MRKTIQLSFVLASTFLIVACNSAQEKVSDKKTEQEVQKTDSAEPAHSKTWIDIQDAIGNMDSTTNYSTIIETLGKPYDEYTSPSVPEEYVLFYDVPGVKGAFFSIMLKSETKTFLHWSGEIKEK